MSPVSRFRPRVSASCADETRASRWKNAVAFLDSAKAAIATSTPALSATTTSMTVKPLWRPAGPGVSPDRDRGHAWASQIGELFSVTAEAR